MRRIRIICKNGVTCDVETESFFKIIQGSEIFGIRDNDKSEGSVFRYSNIKRISGDNLTLKNWKELEQLTEKIKSERKDEMTKIEIIFMDDSKTIFENGTISDVSIIDNHIRIHYNCTKGSYNINELKEVNTWDAPKKYLDVFMRARHMIGKRLRENETERLKNQKKQTDLKLIEKSIKEKWLPALFDGYEPDGAADCPLCLEYVFNDCKNCPIKKFTGYKYCHQTPNRNLEANDPEPGSREYNYEVIKEIKFLLEVYYETLYGQD